MAFFIALVTISRSFFKKITIIFAISIITYFMMQYMIIYMDMKPIMMYIVLAMILVFILVYIWFEIKYGKKPSAAKESNMYKRLQLLSSAAFSLGHGGADSQKVMGIICAALMVYANMGRHGEVNGTIPKSLTVTELLQIEYKNKDGIKEKFKPEYPNGDKMFVYSDGKKIVDNKTNEWIFNNEEFNSKYSNASVFSEVVYKNKILPNHKIVSKVHSETMPFWISFGCYFMIGIGTLMGGWKIVKTMGTKITKVTPLEGVCAETAGALTLFTVSQMGIPVSTTHTITGSIIGVGATKRLSAVRWGVTINLLWAWVLTIPVSAGLASLIYYGINFIK
jgi:PiT family inorganic phosphate transporter